MTLTIYTAPGSEDVLINYSLGECQGWLHLHTDRRYPQPEIYVSDNEKARAKIAKFKLVPYSLVEQGPAVPEKDEEPKPQVEKPKPAEHKEENTHKSGKKE